MNKNQPLVSIITVVYNGEKYLEETIKSVLSQTYKNIEYIIVDGGSKDKSKDIIRKYEKKLSYWVSEKDNGMYDAINKGIKVAKGEIIATLNSDDMYYDKETVNDIVKYFQENEKTEWVYGNFLEVNFNGDIIRKYNIPVYNKKLLKYASWCYIPQPTVFMRKSLVDRVGLFDDQYKMVADYDYFLRCGEISFAHKINRNIVKFRFHSEQLSKSRLNDAIKEHNIIQKRNGIDVRSLSGKIFATVIYLIFKFENIQNYIIKRWEKK